MLRPFATVKNSLNESSEKTAISATRISPICVLEPAAIRCSVDGGRSSGGPATGSSAGAVGVLT